MVKIMEKPIKMDNLGGSPLFLVQHPYDHNIIYPSIHPSQGILKPAAGEFGSGVEIVHGIGDVERITGEEVFGSGGQNTWICVKL